MESRAAASGDDLKRPFGDDLQHAWVDGTAGFDAPTGDVVELSDNEVLDNSPEQSQAEIERLAERVRRQAADRLLWETVQADGFSGRRWSLLVNDLARYGLAVMDAWMRTGYIFAKVKQVGRPLGHTEDETRELATDFDLRAELGAETVAKALERFQQGADRPARNGRDSGGRVAREHNDFRAFGSREHRAPCL